MRSILKGLTAPALICVLSVSCSDDAMEGVASTRPELVAAPQLECADGEVAFNPPVAYDTDSPGAATAEEALLPTLEASAASRQGQIIRLNAAQYGLVVDARIVTIVTASQSRPREWHLVDHSYCEQAAAD